MAFDAAVVLLQPVVQMLAGPVAYSLAQHGPDRARVAVVAIRGDLINRQIKDVTRCLDALVEQLAEPEPEPGQTLGAGGGQISVLFDT